MTTSHGSTSKWKETLNTYYENHVKKDKRIIGYYKAINIDIQKVGVHLAIFAEPFLTLLLSGAKAIESRFSMNKVAPYHKVKPGDIVFVKKSGGAVCGYFIVKEAHYYAALNKIKLNEIKRQYSDKICASAVDDFWESKATCNFASLFDVVFVTEILPVTVEKKDRTAWVPIKLSTNNLIHNEIWKI